MASTPENRILDVVDEVLSKTLEGTVAASITSRIKSEYASRHLPVISATSAITSMENCRTCKDAETVPLLGAWNWQNCDVLFIVPNIQQLDGKIKELAQLLKSTGFNSNFCGLTGLTKCQFKTIDETNIDNCKSFIDDQLSISQPKAIVTFGADPFQLFQTTQRNFTSSLGHSWWWGIYKIFPAPPLATLGNRNSKLDYTEVFNRVYNFVYGTKYDVVSI